MQVIQASYVRPQAAAPVAPPPKSEENEQPDRCSLGETSSMVAGGILGFAAVGALVLARIDPATATELTLQAAFLLSVGGGAAGAALGRMAHRHLC
jgi:hypothetical protein